MDVILVATDLSARSDRAVKRAAGLAAALRARLAIAHVANADLPPALRDARAAQARDALRTRVDADPALSALDPALVVETGRVEARLPDLARSQGAGLLVVGTHRDRGMADLLGAPTLLRLLRGARVPVLVAVGRPETAYRDVSVGWDFSPASEAAARAARAIAPEASFALVHAWAPIVAAGGYGLDPVGLPAGPSEETEADLARAARALGEGVGHVLEVGPPAHALMRRASEGADLPALGTHARAGLARFVLGATAETVALGAVCDVLVAPPA